MSNDRRRCARCRSSLATDNHGIYCGPCSATVDGLRQHPPDVPADFWSDPSIREASRRRHMGHLIAAYRRHPHHGIPISQEIVGAWVGVTQGQISRMENGQPEHNIDRLIHWARLLAIPADLLWFTDPLADSPTVDRTPDTAAPTGPGVAREDSLGILQRVHRLGRTIDPEVIRQLRTLIHDAVDEYEMLNHRDIVSTLVQQRAWIADLLDEISDCQQRKHLFEIGAGASGLLGYLAVGRSDFHLARAYCAEAFKLAELAGKSDVQAWARGLQSICEYYARDYVEALRFAEDGLVHAHAGPQSARLLANGVARAMGKLGDIDGVDRAVDGALALMAGDDVPDGLPSSISFGWYSLAQTASNAATAYVSLGMADRVETYIDLAMPDIRRSGSPWSRSLVMIDQATALVSSRRGDLERASRLAIEAVTVSTGRPIVAVQQRALDFVRQASRQWGDNTHLRTVREAVTQGLPAS